MLCLIIPVIFITTFSLMPDSPHYLIARGDRFAAVNALKFLRGGSSGSKNEEILKEIDDIKLSVEESMSRKSSLLDMFRGKANLLGEFCSYFPRIES